MSVVDAVSRRNEELRAYFRANGEEGAAQVALEERLRALSPSALRNVICHLAAAKDCLRIRKPSNFELAARFLLRVCTVLDGGYPEGDDGEDL